MLGGPLLNPETELQKAFDSSQKKITRNGPEQGHARPSALKSSWEIFAKNCIFSSKNLYMCIVRNDGKKSFQYF